MWSEWHNFSVFRIVETSPPKSQKVSGKYLQQSAARTSYQNTLDFWRPQIFMISMFVLQFAFRRFFILSRVWPLLLAVHDKWKLPHWF